MPTNIVSCCIVGCQATSVHNHRFPNPKKYLDRFNKWLYILDMNELRLMDPYLVYTNKRICSAHFDSKYKSPGNPRLHSNAVPTLHQENPGSSRADSAESIQPSISVQEQGSADEGEYTVFALPTTGTKNEIDNISAPPQVESVSGSDEIDNISTPVQKEIVSDDHSRPHGSAELHTVELTNAICKAEDSPAASEDPSEDSLLRRALTHHVDTTQGLVQQPTQQEEIKVFNQIICNKQATIDPTQLCAVVPSARRPANKIAAVLNGFTHPPVQVVKEECVEPEAKRICLEEPNVSTEAEVHLQDQHVTRLTKLRVAKVTTIKLITLTKD